MKPNPLYGEAIEKALPALQDTAKQFEFDLYLTDNHGTWLLIPMFPHDWLEKNQPINYEI